MNWVERRVSRQRALNTGSPEVWNVVRQSIQDACESYTQICGPNPDRQVKCQLENGKRVRISKSLRLKHTDGHRDDVTTIVVSFEQNPPKINVAGEGPMESLDVFISSDEESAFIGSTKGALSADALCERILSPLLFPTVKYTNLP